MVIVHRTTPQTAFRAWTSFDASRSCSGAIGCFDHVMHDLERKLAEFQVYHNAARSQSSLDGHTPLIFAGGHTLAPADLSHVRWVSHCRDLGQLPLAA
jgi:hypothetical protein